MAHYDELARLARALASPARLRLIDLLRQAPRSVDELAAQAGLEVANTSQHLKQLKAARLVIAERAGQHVVYRLASDRVSAGFFVLRELAEAQLPEMDRLRTGLEVLDVAEREALLRLIDSRRVTLVDVRPAEEFRAGHLAGARSIPLEQLPDRLEELPKGREVVAYCRGPYCPFALEAVEILKAAGFKARHFDLSAADLAPRQWQLEVADGDHQPEPSPPAGPKGRRKR